MGGDCPRRSIPIRCAARGRFEPSVVYQFVPVPNSPATSCFISGAAQPGRARLAGRHEPSVGDHAAFCLDYLRLSAGRNGAAADIRIAAFDTEFDDDTQPAKVAETIRKLPNVDIWALFSIPIRKSFGRRGRIPLLITLGFGLLSLAAIDRISTKARYLRSLEDQFALITPAQEETFAKRKGRIGATYITLWAGLLGVNLLVLRRM